MKMTEAEIQQLLNDGFSHREIAAKAGVTKSSIDGRVYRMRHPSAPRQNGRRWTLEEDAVIREKAATHLAIEMMEFLPGRSLSSIEHRRLRLNITDYKRKPAPPKPCVREWTEADDETLENYYGHKTVRELAALTGFSISTIAKHARRLGLTTTLSPWPADCRFEDHPHPYLKGEITVLI